MFDLAKLHELFTKYINDMWAALDELNLNFPEEWRAKKFNFEEFCEWWRRLTPEKQLYWSSIFSEGYAAEIQRIEDHLRKRLSKPLKTPEPPATTEAQTAEEHSKKVTKWLVDAQNDQPPAEPPTRQQVEETFMDAFTPDLRKLL